jgi:hypothetical protein
MLLWMCGIAVASIMHVAATHCHHIIVVPSLLSNRHCPVAVLKLPPLLSSTSLPLAATAASLPSLLPSTLPSPPLPSSLSLLTLLCQRCFVIVIKMRGGQVSLVLILRIPTYEIWQGCLWFVETNVFGDHDTPHRQPTNAIFDNKPLMKRGKTKVRVLQMRTIMAIHWGLPAHDSNPHFFGLTGGTQFSTMYSIQYGCVCVDSLTGARRLCQ